MTQRVMLIHSSETILDLNDPWTHAHTFGPFDSHEEAMAFDALHPDDCFKATLPIVGPADEDIGRTLQEDAKNRPLTPAEQVWIEGWLSLGGGTYVSPALAEKIDREFH